MARELRKAAVERPGLTAALDHLRAGDTLAVWKLDRLGRSVKDVLTIADDLQPGGIGVGSSPAKLPAATRPPARASCSSPSWPPSPSSSAT